MEEHFSLHVCEGLIRECLFPKACAALPPDNRAVAAFSLKQSSAFTESLVVSEDYCPDQPKSRLSEDVPILTAQKRSIRVCPPLLDRVSLHPKLSTLSRSSKMSRTEDQVLQSSLSFNPPKLMPLQIDDDSEHSEEESEDFETKLRERKIHQQYFRTRYEANMRQGTLKKKGFAGKTEGKGPNLVAYDFDGGIIPAGKSQTIKLPIHFLDLQVTVEKDQEQKDLKQKASKVKIQAKSQSVRKDELKVAESHFLKDFNNVHWTDGVELRQSKQECRKILGYQNPNVRRKKVDLLKNSEQPVRIRFQDLKSYQNLLSNNSQLFLRHQNLRRDSEKSVLGHLPSNHSSLGPKGKFITVSNSRALQFLMDAEGQDENRRSGFVSSKQQVKHVHY